LLSQVESRVKHSESIPLRRRSEFEDTKFVAFRLSDVDEAGHECGVTHRWAASTTPVTGLSSFFVNTSPAHIHARGVLSDAQKQSAFIPAQWTNCFPTQNVPKRLLLSFVLDTGYVRRYKSNIEAAIASIYDMITNSNFMYVNQMNVYLVVKSIAVAQSLDDPQYATWNDAPSSGPKTCRAQDMSTTLNNLVAWRRTLPAGNAFRDAAATHLMTDCFPPPGTVGLAYVGTLCQTPLASGVNTYSATTWKTFAHELGHNFGGNHAFQEGQGRTGGIMDCAYLTSPRDEVNTLLNAYHLPFCPFFFFSFADGDGKLQGTYQFHTVSDISLMISIHRRCD
jgi:hypothetical protein